MKLRTMKKRESRGNYEYRHAWKRALGSSQRWSNEAILERIWSEAVFKISFVVDRVS